MAVLWMVVAIVGVASASTATSGQPQKWGALCWSTRLLWGSLTWLASEQRPVTHHRSVQNFVTEAIEEKLGRAGKQKKGAAWNRSHEA